MHAGLGRDKNSDEDVELASFKVPAWYAWAVKNWGTKWNACDAEYSTIDPENVIWFDTAWSPPVAVFEALARHFSAHEIVIHSDECLNHLHVTFTLKDGQVTWVDHPFGSRISPGGGRDQAAVAAAPKAPKKSVENDFCGKV